MNRENVLRVADAIEKHEIKDLGFDMASYMDSENAPRDTSGFDCGTTACIGGWAVILGRKKPLAEIYQDDIDWFEEGQDILGLTKRQAEQLFEGFGARDRITPAQAIRTLRHLADTGVVDWSLPETDGAAS